MMSPKDRDKRMKTSEFDYVLDPERIAQTPVEPRDAARLMVVNRADATIAHRQFREIGDYLSAGDLLIFNDSRVIAARLFTRKLHASRPSEKNERLGGRVELLLLNRRDDGYWRVLVKGKRVREGTRLMVLDPRSEHPTEIEATVIQVGERGERAVAFDPPLDIGAALDRVGTVPLPPYIHTTLEDAERYQTVYARWPGSAAAPTAGLHFTPELLLALREKGVEFGFVTLHIGLDTFRPVVAEHINGHTMHSEYAVLDWQTAQRINQARLEGRRVIAVGTTAVRVLESAAQNAACVDDDACAWQTISAFEGTTTLFITPGYPFRVVDRLITNFHLPRSTLLMLVAAFADLELVRQAYQAAIENDYRFYSFGDAMIIL
jgi:S-adenosylmethionine:tRNA ribosyltransferase-isomerase